MDGRASRSPRSHTGRAAAFRVAAMRVVGRRNFAAVAGSLGLAIALALVGSAAAAKRQARETPPGDSPSSLFGPGMPAPAPPTRLAVVSTTPTSITISWRQPWDYGVAGYTVFRDGVRVTSLSSSATRFTFAGLACGRSYVLGVEAYDRAGNASARPTMLVPSAACTDNTAPSTPGGLAQADVTESSLTVRWTAATDNVGVVGYEVFLAGDLVGSTASTLYGLTGLACGTMYTIGVRAFDAAGHRSPTASVILTTSPCPDRSAPSRPSGLVVSSVNETSVTVRWNAASDDRGVAGYGIYRGTTPAGTTQATSYTVSGLTCGSGYTIAVDAFDAAGNRSARSAIAASTSSCPAPLPPPPNDTSAPTIPGGVTATGATATSISVRWNASTDNVRVAGYGLYRDGTSAGSSSVTNATFSGLACGRSYLLAVDAYDASGNRSARANVVTSTSPCPDTTPPSAPTGLTQTSNTESTIGLDWNAATDTVGVAGYGVYLAGVRVATTGTPGYTLGSLTCGTTYTVGVDAYDAAGSRSAQTTLVVQTKACAADRTPPSPPQNQTISAVTAASFKMSWSPAVDNVGVTDYAVYLDGARVAVTPSTSYTYTGLSCSQTYTVGLEARDAAGNASDIRYATGRVSTSACGASAPAPPPTDSQAPTAPGNPAVGTVSQTSVAVSWSPSSDNVGVTGYGYYRGTTSVGNGTGTSYVFSGLSCGTGYSFAIDAVDAAGNRSAKSTVTATTGTCPAAPPGGGGGGGGGGSGTANLWVDTTGGSCARQATPGAYSDAQACSWNAAYQAAQTGDLILVRGGSYGDVKIGPNKASLAPPGVTFRTADGASVVVDDLENGHIAGGTGGSNISFVGPASARTFRSDKASNVVVDNWHVDCGGCNGVQTFHLEAADNVVVRNSEIENNNNNSLMWISGSNLRFDNNLIHDAGLPSGSGAHTECMYAWNVTNLTLRSNHFWHCSVMDVFITGSSVANGGLVENNVFEKPWSTTGQIGNGFAFHFRNGGSPSPDPSSWDFRYNTFVGPLSITPSENPVGSGGMRVIGNVFLAGAPCGHANTTYSHNAFASGGCGTNTVVSSLATLLGGFVATGDPGNYALLPTSVLRDKGSPTVYPSGDKAGNARPSGPAPDIGAYEFR